MGVKIVCKAKPNTGGGVSQYWTRLQSILGKADIAVDWVSIEDWKAGKAKGDPKADILIVDNHMARLIQPEYAVIAVQHGCAAEHGLRSNDLGCIDIGRNQFSSARRERTFWVACSDWAAYHCKMHMGVTADRIITGTVDTDSFFPAERQRVRQSKKPVILHHCVDPNKGSGVIGSVATTLGADFEVKQLDCEPDKVPEAMRAADMWLCLSQSEGLPTVVQEALATNLIVVGTNVGVLWPFCEGEPAGDLASRRVGWFNRTLGAVVFPWLARGEAAFVAALIRWSWANKGKFGAGRDFARQWWSYPIFGQKWLAAIQAACQKLGVALA